MCLISGSTEDLAEVARAAHGWRQGVPLQDIRRSVPFVKLTHLGEVAEQGPTHVVPAQWRWLRQHSLQSPKDLALIEAAYAEPKLRQLYPYTSHSVLNFSTTTGYPFSPSPVHLNAAAVHLTYSVYSRSGLLGETDTAEEAVSLAVAHLPTDLGPAVAGTWRADGQQ
jgi:hypothetical protein